MKLLILGGTKFLGRHLVDAALADGHQVTLFNRGKTNPELFPNVEQRHGDRDGDLQALSDGTWDVVIDTSGYVPRVVRASAELLRPRTKKYVFISSVSVYADFAIENIDEDYPVGQVDDPTTEDVSEFYGPLKALCEQAVQDVYGDQALIIRPGLIVGPNDPTDRFTYWVRRFAQGGDVLVPGRPQRLQQFIDVRDLAEWTIRASVSSLTGVFNATGPAQRFTMGELVEDIRATVPNAGSPVWAAEEFLAQHEVAEWSEMPLWIAESHGWPGFEAASIDRALKAGLTFRPVPDTIRDTWEWDKDRTGPMLAGMDPKREAELLEAWAKR